jgi:hypothetical protein
VTTCGGLGRDRKTQISRNEETRIPALAYLHFNVLMDSFSVDMRSHLYPDRSDPIGTKVGFWMDSTRTCRQRSEVRCCVRIRDDTNGYA